MASTTSGSLDFEKSMMGIEYWVLVLVELNRSWKVWMCGLGTVSIPKSARPFTPFPWFTTKSLTLKGSGKRREKRASKLEVRYQF